MPQYDIDEAYHVLDRMYEDPTALLPLSDWWDERGESTFAKYVREAIYKSDDVKPYDLVWLMLNIRGFRPFQFFMELDRRRTQLVSRIQDELMERYRSFKIIESLDPARNQFEIGFITTCDYCPMIAPQDWHSIPAISYSKKSSSGIRMLPMRRGAEVFSIDDRRAVIEAIAYVGQCESCRMAYCSKIHVRMINSQTSRPTRSTSP